MIYTKIIEGRQVFSDCRVIQMEDGTWISNPSEEQIAEAGWVEYIPPVVPPAPVEAPEMEDVMEAVKKMLSSSIESLTDEEALEIAALYPTWISRVGTDVVAGERLWYDEFLWKVLQPHTAQLNWTPEDSPSLFVKVSIEEWPEWVQPVGSEDAYKTGDKVRHNDKHWISNVDGNVWEPGAVGTEALWQEVEYY